MLCEEVRQSLSAYIDDALTLPARVATDEHLDRCPVCRDEVVKLRSVTRESGCSTASHATRRSDHICI